jgi:hypothetical protein
MIPKGVFLPKINVTPPCIIRILEPNQDQFMPNLLLNDMHFHKTKTTPKPKTGLSMSQLLKPKPNHAALFFFEYSLFTNHKYDKYRNVRYD